MSLPFDWFILLLRVLFVFLLYFFLFQIVRTIARELRAVSIATAGGPSPRAVATQPAAQLILLEATEAGLPAGQLFPVRSGAVVGRREGSAIHLNDTYISNEHARLFLNDGRHAHRPADGPGAGDRGALRADQDAIHGLMAVVRFLRSWRLIRWRCNRARDNPL
jgi:hypothetical protein